MQAMAQSHCWFIGINHALVSNPEALYRLQIQLDVSFALQKQVYFILEEHCDWKKPPFDAYPVLPGNHLPVNTEAGLDYLLDTAGEVDKIVDDLKRFLATDNLAAEYVGLILNARKTNELDLRNRGLRDIPPVVFSLNNLKSLNFSGNKLKQIPTGIRQLQNLEDLNLRGNPMLRIIPNEVLLLTKLETLDLSETMI